MTDYLEPRQGENEDALWEAARLLNALLRSAGEEAPGAEEEPAELSRREDLEEPARAEGPESGDRRETPAAVDRKEGEEAERPPLPLLDELEALDRALEGRELLERARTAAAREGGPAAGTGRKAPWTGREGPRRETGDRTGRFRDPEEAERSAAGGRAAAWTDEALQAERVDQVFRRDSRRYDGGFFLY